MDTLFKGATDQPRQERSPARDVAHALAGLGANGGSPERIPSYASGPGGDDLASVYLDARRQGQDDGSALATTANISGLDITLVKARLSEYVRFQLRQSGSMDQTERAALEAFLASWMPDEGGSPRQYPGRTLSPRTAARVTTPGPEFTRPLGFHQGYPILDLRGVWI